MKLPSTWTEEEFNILLLNYKKLNHEQLSKLLRKSKYAIKHCININKLYTKNYSQEEIDFIKNNFMKMEWKEMENYLNRPFQGIKSIAKKLGLKKYKTNNFNKLLDESLTSYYWVGFLLGDGHFRKNLNETVLALSEVDKDHLEKYGNYINSNNIKIVKNKFKNKEHILNVITTRCTETLPLLKIKFDIKDRKTYNPPDFSKYNFTDEQILALIIGFIDADGCINQNKHCRGHGISIIINLHESWRKNLEFMNYFIHKISGNVVQNKICTTSLGLARLQISKKSALSFIKKFIKDNDLPILERKWNKITF